MSPLIIIVIIFLFILYLLLDFFITGESNDFMLKWLKRTLWIWLPFYSLQYLIRELAAKVENKKTSP
jgi:hypothetical protein